ncbi:hypothetical protein TWF730_011306 [Orbilia blumenaviensis]|uniref:F-box domain-containing protein n=1 Tax=Orbilia blumenaviensis TaxID=1796055 RepID=A0AAV9UND7_9PEZI
MKESLLTQLKRNLSNRSRKGKESSSSSSQPRPETPNTLKFLDVDNDARSTYSVESDTKSFFSFSFENSESKALECDFETPVYTYRGSRSAGHGGFPRAEKEAVGVDVDGEGGLCGPPPSYDVDRLEWILFYPEGVGRRFVGMFGINDVVALSQVCRAWRRWLVPERENARNCRFARRESPESDISSSSSVWHYTRNGRLRRWHPLVQTVIATTPPVQGSRDFVEPLRFYGRYHRQSIMHWQKYEFSIPRLLCVWGDTYLSSITYLHLDVAALEMDSNWLAYCLNLELLSIRRCAGVTVDRLSELLLGTEEELQPNSSKKKKQKALTHIPRPEKLRTVWFWGIDGARQLAYPYNSDQHISDRHKLEKRCNRLMERFETDVSWCLGVQDAGPFRKTEYKLLISHLEPCSTCGRARKDSGWGDGVTCERCLGFICRRCLNMKTVAREDSAEDHEVPNAPAINMLQLLCNQGNICGWENGEHHVHPECIPPASLLWGHNDPLKHVFETYAHLQKRTGSHPS